MAAGTWTGAPVSESHGRGAGTERFSGGSTRTAVFVRRHGMGGRNISVGGFRGHLHRPPAARLESILHARDGVLCVNPRHARCWYRPAMHTPTYGPRSLRCSGDTGRIVHTP